MKTLPFLVLLLTMSMSGISQTLSFYADAMVNSDKPENRRYAAEQFEILFEKELYEETSLTRSFSELPWLSIQYAQDSSFRFISWQVDHGEGRFSYGGYLQTSKNKITKIGGPRGRSSHESNDVLPIDKWKGGIVYKVLSPINQTDSYYLLTYKMLNQFTKVKTLEPLSISEENVSIGSKDHFVNSANPDALSSRLVLVYSFDTNAGITYEDESNRFVFDNLIVVAGRAPKQGPTAVPDGSYKAYEYQSKGQWTYIDKLYDQYNTGVLNPNRKKKLNNELFKKNK